MSLRDWFFHKHYWGSPHTPDGEKRIIQICYECGKQREIRIDLRPKDNQPAKDKLRFD